MTTRHLLGAVPAATIAATLGLAACGSGDPEPARDVQLTRTTACAEAWFHAATEDGDVAVTVSVDARDRSTTEASTWRFDLADEASDVDAQVLWGDDLPRNFCTDLIDGDAEPRDHQRAIAGTGTITLEPPGEWDGCGNAHGELEVTGLVAEDGTSFAPITVESESIGCYAG